MAEFELSPGVTYEELTSDISKEFFKHQKGHPSGFVRLQPYDQVKYSAQLQWGTYKEILLFYLKVMPRSYLKYEKAMKEFEVRDDDVWVITFPKCGKSCRDKLCPLSKPILALCVYGCHHDLGTTWTQEMVWLIMNQCDMDKAKKSTLEERVPFVEWDMPACFDIKMQLKCVHIQC